MLTHLRRNFISRNTLFISHNTLGSTMPIHRPPVRILTSLLLLALCLASPVLGQKLKRETALGIAPADSEFFLSLLRNKEQAQMVLKSRAYKRMLELPALQALLKQMSAVFEQDGSPVKAVLDQPENKELLALLTDAVSNEIAIYGEKGFGKTLVLWQSLMNSIQFAQLEAIASGQNPEEVVVKRLVAGLTKVLSESEIPTMVIAMKVTRPRIAIKQMARLEGLAKMVGQVMPKLAGKIKRAKIGGGDYISLSIKGSDLPLDDLASELGEQVAGRIIAAMRKLTLSFSVGVRKNYVVVSIGPNTKHLARLGNGRSLADLKLLAPMYGAAEKKLTLLSYTSKEFMNAVASPKTQLKQITEMVQRFLPLAGLSQGLHKELSADIDKFVDFAASKAPQPGLSFGFTYLTSEGYEGYSYNHSKNASSSPKPLTILNHVGGNPTLLIANRGESDPAEFQQLVTFVKKLDYYGMKIAKEKLAGQELAIVQKLRTGLTPLFKKLAATTRNNLIPALKDGQTAFVMDFQTRAKSWHAALPPHQKPLPMIGLALVFGVSDAAKLQKACSDYFAFVQGVVDVVGQLNPNGGGIKIPPPSVKQIPSGKIYYYAFPQQWGVNSLLAPNAGLSKSIGVLSLLPEQTARILKGQTTAAISGLIRQHPSSHSVVHFQSSDLVEALKVWADYGYGFVAGFQAEEEVKVIQRHIDVITDFVACFRSYTGATYRESDTNVTHFVWKFQDVAK